MIIVTCGMLLATLAREAGTSTGTVAVDPVRSVGNPTATGSIVVFTDFQCHFCAALAQEALPVIRRTFVDPGLATLYIRHLSSATQLPFPGFAGEASECAGAQDRLIDFHDRLFLRRGQLHPTTLRRHAEELGLEMNAFDRCVSERTFASRIAEDTQAAQQLVVTGTPTILIGWKGRNAGIVNITQRFDGQVPSEQLADAIEDALVAGRPIWMRRTTWMAIALLFLVAASVRTLLPRRGLAQNNS